MTDSKKGTSIMFDGGRSKHRNNIEEQKKKYNAESKASQDSIA
jgi:hypothetical protein